MRFRVELSSDAQKQLARFPRDVRERFERAIDEFEEKRRLPIEQPKGVAVTRVEGTDA